MTEITGRLSTALADRYQIERHLGEGGMATVYLAEDLKHKRKVALKVLRPELAAVLGAERFVQEITTTANLQHPHILPLFDSGEADSFLYYVMPFIDGETLRQKLDRETQLSIDEAVSIATDIAGALDYAHQQGVIHRDIKPENILIHNGRPMVADFGIALAVSAAAGGRMTETGLSLGTPHYMSPEQATAEKDLTARSDVYSLGSVLYEMLTGEPPHTGGSAQAIIMKIVTEPADTVTKIRKSVPPHVAAATAQSLEKLAADRFDSAAKFAAALTNPSFTVPTTQAAVAAAPTSDPWKRVAIAAAGVAVVAVLIAALGWTRAPAASPTTRLDLSLGSMVFSGVGEDIAVSPDGSMFAVSGTLDGETAIFLRRREEADFNKVPGTENGLRPSFSPDNEWIVFRDNAEGTLVRVAVAGGGLLTLMDDDAINPWNPHWGEDGTIVFSGPTGIHVIPAEGGPPRPVPSVGGRRPYVLPDGSGLLGAGAGTIQIHDFASDSTWEILADGRHPTYVESGHILYVPASGGLFAVPFDLDRREVTGTPQRVLDRVASAISRRGYAVSRNGTLVHHEGEPAGGTGGAQRRFVIIDRSRSDTYSLGSVTYESQGVTDTVRHPVGQVDEPRFSPDGRTIAYDFLSGGSGSDIYTYDLLTGTNPQITFEGDNDGPIWSPDGTQILFRSERDGSDGDDLYAKPADNSAGAESVLSRPGNQRPTHWLEDDVILFQSNEAGSQDLWTYSTSGGGDPEPYLEAPWGEFMATVSPDGTLAAYVSNETGNTFDIWLHDFPVPAGKWRVSFGGGVAPRWSPDGSTLYYWKGAPGADSLFAVAIERDPAVVVRQPEFVLAAEIAGNLALNWDLHPDGQRFLVTVDDRGSAATPGEPSPTRFLVVLNWFEELKGRVGN